MLYTEIISVYSQNNKKPINIQNAQYMIVGPSGRVVWGVGTDGLGAEIMGRIPLKAWTFFLPYTCCAVLCR